MKCRVIIDASKDEEVIICVRQRTALSDDIENYIASRSSEITAFDDTGAVKLNLSEVLAFCVEENRVYAITENQKLKIKQRLYAVEERLSENFVRINQSCIVNLNRIARFDASISGTLSVIMKNGYKDYVSRRQLKAVKERMGL